MKLDQIMIGCMLDKTSLGIYSAAVYVSELWHFIPTAIANTMLPILVSKYKENNVFLDNKLKELGYAYEYQLIKKGASEVKWGATQEYAGNLFFDNGYGEYINEYEVRLVD